MNRLVNSTVLSNFAAVQRLDLLRDAVGPFFLTTEVYDEILAGQLAGYVFYAGIERHIAPFVPDGWLRLVAMTEAEIALSASLSARLHRGEVSCLCIAQQRGWGFLTDERLARRQAEKWNIPFSGTLGVLLLAIQDGRLTVDDGNALLHEMIVRAQYRSPVTDSSELLS